MSYPLVNTKPHFIPYDICMIKKTKEIVIITEVNCNTGQTEDEHQWSYSVEPVSPGLHKVAWYNGSELVFMKNIFEVIAKKSVNNFSSSRYKFDLSKKRDDRE